MAEDKFIELKKIKSHQGKEKFKALVKNIAKKGAVVVGVIGKGAVITGKRIGKGAILTAQDLKKLNEGAAAREIERLDNQIEKQKKLSKLRGLQKKNRPKGEKPHDLDMFKGL